jgi:Flp pilus assembly pilin Flp
LLALLRVQVQAVSDDGQDVVEYGLLIATIAVVVLVGTASFGNLIRPWFELLAGRITTVGT